MATTTVHNDKLEREEQQQVVKWAYQGLKSCVQEIVDRSFDEAKVLYREQCGSGTPSTFHLDKEHRRKLKDLRVRLCFTRKQFKQLLKIEIKSYLEEKGKKSTGYNVTWGRLPYMHV